MVGDIKGDDEVIRGQKILNMQALAFIY